MIIVEFRDFLMYMTFTNGQGKGRHMAFKGRKIVEAGVSTIAGGVLAVCFSVAAAKTFEFVVKKIGEYVSSAQIEDVAKKDNYNKQHTP